MVGEHQRQHCLGNRRRANADAGVVTSLGDHLDRVALHIDAATRYQYARSRFERDSGHDRLPRRNASQNAACIV